MTGFRAAFWAAALKARRSKVSLLAALTFDLFAPVSGLFMVILKDPEAARAMGLISTKAQLVAGSADWPAFFDVLLQATAMGGTILFAFIMAWIFGREYADRTAKDLLALPTPRTSIVGAKLALAALWIMGLSLMVFGLVLLVGAAIDIPGWSVELAWSAFGSLMAVAALNLALLPFVALVASAGRGYLAPLGWAFFIFLVAQVMSLLGWGGWFPWSVPVLLSGMFGPQGVAQVGPHSYTMVLLALLAGVAATLSWWLTADQLS